MWIKAKNYLSLVKFSHTIFAMPFAMIGFFLAVREHPSLFQWSTLVAVVACMVFARSAAMGFNRWLDRDIDQRNPRTSNREIPKGIVRPREAMGFVVMTSLLFIATTWLINPLCFWLSPLALLVVLGYSYTKRFTALCHLVLGLGLSLAPIGAYLAVVGHFEWLPVVFSIVVICWVSGFDMIYALQDDHFDRHQNLHSMPVLLGRKGALVLSSSLHAMACLLVLAAGWYGAFGWMYWMGAAVFVGMLIYQHLLVKPQDLSKVNIAFMTANGIASCVFAGFVIASLYI